ncbi:MAG TPA: hypothetical protein VFT60_13220, partial [Bryobacteraceae bacterium]|nr:hypothetical protein [Bryobacteraceae bacterium]
GWIGAFVLGIGYHSLAKMGRPGFSAVRRAWLTYGLWTSGVALRWVADVTAWEWRIALPLSALLELGGFLAFFITVSGHRRSDSHSRQPPQLWMKLVVASTLGFFVTLLANVAAVTDAALRGAGPAIAHELDQRLLILPVWAFLVPMVWGFNARWLPIFLGLRAPSGKPLLAAVVFAWLAVAATLAGHSLAGGIAAVFAAIAGIAGLHVLERAPQPAKITGVHRSFPFFVRLTYVWLSVAACLTVWAAAADRAGGIWGASRHALTVGFLAAMVFAIGQRILPAFCGARLLFSPNLMFASLALLNLGCVLRVASEIPAYEGYAAAAWSVLPVSGILELAAVALFAANLVATFSSLPAHKMRKLVPAA